MCGRYALTSPPEILAALFKLATIPTLAPRYNIAPTQTAPVIRFSRSRKVRMLTEMRWGLVPFWAKDASIGSQAINARSESAAEKPMFREAFRRRRCLVPADGFYEWRKIDDRTKQPYYVRRADQQPLAYAGLWERWKDAEGAAIDTYTILTTTPAERLRELHDRMPVILDPREYGTWLNPDTDDPARLASLLDPFPGEELDVYPVSRQVNTPANDDPSLVEPVEEEGPEPTLFG